MTAALAFLAPFVPEPWSDSEIRVACEVLGIDLQSYLCDCEACSRATTFCPATRSALILAIQGQERKP